VCQARVVPLSWCVANGDARIC
jgi:hypothetical protein